MIIAVKVLLLMFTLAISATLTQINLVNGSTENNPSTGETSTKSKDVFALLQLEKDVGKYEGTLKELHSGYKSPFDLLGTIKNEEKFKPQSGSILPEYNEPLNGNNK